ncbi:TonB-dependent receptor [Pontibacter qinzhouensis]|uniref:TonB-dependent receptor n=1 Tax=Pontibacter qinzhouensis TaxID=2603253 RepID=A0A5C8J4K6_9BACT|nr:TonB-dependent receptor [Pontibacter qinzhouensis]TXK31104.1 TonB-dependent receptor [Pontibacter qinzhouensis]
MKKIIYPFSKLLLPCMLLGVSQVGFSQQQAFSQFAESNLPKKTMAALAGSKAGATDKGGITRSLQQEGTVTGRVLDENGTGLPGVTVMLKGTSLGTSTDLDGNFSLAAPAANNTLVISYVGYVTQEVPVNNRTTLNINLVPDAKALQEVIVVGYGTQNKANLTGAVSTVSGQTLTQRPAPNAANLIQGRVTGVQVTQPSAEPGRDNPNFVVRGRGTFGNTGPLVLIDGVVGSFNNLSPDDIESVTVLKDAASASIYGSRASNGVILVTTKRGKAGQLNISYRGNVATHTPTALPDLITNSAEYMEMYNQAAERNGIAFRYTPEQIAQFRNATDREQFPNFDNVDYYINPATVTNHSLSVSGGGEKSSFNLSLGYLDQNAMISGYNFKRYNALLSYTSELSKYVRVGTVMNLTHKDRNEPPFTGENMALSIYAAGPLYGPFLPDGSGRIVSRAYQLEGRNRNPQEYYAMGRQRTQEYNANAQAFIDITPLKGLTWSTKAALNYVDEFYKMHQTPYTAYLSQERNPTTGDYRADSFGPDILGVTDQYSKELTPTIFSTLTYEKSLNDMHNFKALVGYEQVSYKFQTLRARRINTASPVLDELTAYTAENQSLFFTHPRLPGLNGPSEWALQSYFGRLNYDYKGKYLLEANLRYDGTSRVSPGYRWGAFPSFSAGWLMSEEDFFRNTFSDAIGNFKLRGSYGILGNQNIGPYAYHNNLVINNVFYPFGNTTAQQGAVVNLFVDQSIRWESTRMLDLGFDMDIKNGLLGIAFDWFRKTGFDNLASPPVPASLGLGAPTINNGEIRSQGIELELTHQNKVGEVTYGVNALISTARNKVIDIPVPSRGSLIRENGLPFDSHFLYQWDGIFQLNDFNDDGTLASNVPRHVANANPRPGDLKMKDQNGDGIVDADDRVVVKGAYPDYIYSFGFNVGFKGFSLDAFFQGVQGQQSRVTGWGVDPFHQGAAPTEKWRNAWTPSNPTNELPALYVQGYPGVQAYVNSTYYLRDASYLRLKNVVLSYSLPSALVSRIKAKGISVYVSGENLLTWTKYEGGDPERASITGNFAQYPQAKIYNVGTNINF